MSENLVTALEITVIGMTLVFGSIVLLWGVMAALVRLTAERRPAEAAAPGAEAAARDLKRRAAIAATAVALAMAQEDEWTPRLFPLPPTAHVSAWQAVRRANQLEQRGPAR
jgi:Na+-transporting methylmalonyl-CoA/oxaloacetate decarboxylase gamma subunit